MSQETIYQPMSIDLSESESENNEESEQDTLIVSNLKVWPDSYEPYTGPRYIDVDGWPL